MFTLTSLPLAMPRPHTAYPQLQRPQTQEHPAFSGPSELVSPQPLPLQAPEKEIPFPAPTAQGQNPLEHMGRNLRLHSTLTPHFSSPEMMTL